MYARLKLVRDPAWVIWKNSYTCPRDLDLTYPSPGEGWGGAVLYYHIKRGSISLSGQLHTHPSPRSCPDTDVDPKGTDVHVLPLRIFNLKRSTVRAFVVPWSMFKGIKPKKIWQEIMSSFRIDTSWGEKFWSHAHKTGSWYLLGVKNTPSHAHKTGS